MSVVSDRGSLPGGAKKAFFPRETHRYGRETGVAGPETTFFGR